MGSNIEHYRTLQKKTPRDMATTVGITEVAYRNIERDMTDVTIERIMQIGDALQIQYAQILDIDKSQVFNYYNSGTDNVFAHTNYHKLSEGYKAAIEQYKAENNFLSKQNR